MQDLFGLDGGKYGKGILDSSRIKLVMQMEEQEARLIQGVLNLSEDEVRQITRFHSRAVAFTQLSYLQSGAFKLPGGLFQCLLQLVRYYIAVGQRRKQAALFQGGHVGDRRTLRD